jgi:enoyl-CoA hydratase
MTDAAERITTEARGHVLHIGLNRPDKLNAFDVPMLGALAAAFTQLEDDDALRCGVLFAHGDHFTAGLDLAEVGPRFADGDPLFPNGAIDPLGIRPPRRTKPMVIAVQGWCLTIGIELILAADIAVAAHGTRFGQIEVNRGIFPFGGATVRWPARSGWGNAMRYLLTGDVFGAAEAHRLGLIQERVPRGVQRQVATRIAERVAAQAPLGVRATLESAAAAMEGDPIEALAALDQTARSLFATADADEGVQSFVERRTATFKGR